MRWSKITECGPVRPRNEDNLCACPDLGLFAVADGMGGHRAGDVASRTALLAFEHYFRMRYNTVSFRQLLYESVIAANDAVYASSLENPQRKGMGTTLTACHLHGNDLLVANVGDSRALLLRNGGIIKLTSDHSLVQALIDGGGITEEDAANHPRRNVLTRALGIGPVVEVDIFQYLLIKGDRLLLCTDGLSAFVNERRIAEIMGLPIEPDEIVGRLLKEALDSGSNDNITMIYLAVD